MRISLLLLGSVLLSSACVATSHSHDHAHEAATPPPGSNQMLRAPITISDDLEVIISDVVIPAGATVPRHYHPGEEFIYVIEGSAVHVEAGKPDQILKAGYAYVIPPEAEHAPRGGPEGARAIVFRVHKAGLPERVNVGEKGPIPDVSELGLNVSASGLAELQAKVEGREDGHCHPMSRPAIMCHVAGGREVYTFTEPGDPAHPAALFRGFVTAEDGTPRLEERGWTAGDAEAAETFFASVHMWPETAAD